MQRSGPGGEPVNEHPDIEKLKTRITFVRYAGLGLFLLACLCLIAARFVPDQSAQLTMVAVLLVVAEWCAIWYMLSLRRLVESMRAVERSSEVDEQINFDL